jgi:hypothetical protein
MRVAPREAGCDAPGAAQGFPSGRTAIVECLRRAGVTPETVVAMPECVTDCLADAVRQCARPVPIRSAFEQCRQTIGAAIVYEQWGWPVPPAAESHIAHELGGLTVIVDRVDSADYFARKPAYGAFDVLSLSKVLGTPAGGIARQLADNAYLHFEFHPGTDPSARSSAGHAMHPAVRELYKRSRRVHPAVTAWLDGNCALQAALAERLARHRATLAVLRTSLAAGWPGWMARAVEAGAGPVWAPVLRGAEPGLQWRAVAYLARSWGVGSTVRLFNWTGDPLAPCFEPCVALPIHAGVDGLSEIVSALERSLG